MSLKMRGVINFRNIPGTNIYTLGQPMVEAIDEVIDRIKHVHPKATCIVWVTLRKEPVISDSLAKDYGGISAEQLEVLEEHLRDDIISELHASGGKLLLYTETPDSSVIPVWEEPAKHCTTDVDVFYHFKVAVDDAIDQCAEVFDLRDSIEEARIHAEQATDGRKKQSFAQKGLQNLRWYFELIVFQAYLQSTEPDTLHTYQMFEAFVKNLPVIKTFKKELLAEGIDALKSLKCVDLADGIALLDEVMNIVANHSGSILLVSKILKSDFFMNLQKMSLPEWIEGSPNFHCVPLVLQLESGPETPSSTSTYFVPSKDGNRRYVYGRYIFTLQFQLRRALLHVNTGPEGTNRVVWTSLQEEPVIYVAGQPHVLCLVDCPLENIKAIRTSMSDVEDMEVNFKCDVIREVWAGDGRILLYDKVEERPNVFSIVPLWENASEDDIMTPGNIFHLMVKEGYKIDYGQYFAQVQDVGYGNNLSCYR
ncbi:hypothetical protein BC827DRAFT_1269475 [Russula dissimulans]|nr:hypothetical protein BC827DRAFT_1269475 [Russula dissimulans]